MLNGPLTMDEHQVLAGRLFPLSPQWGLPLSSSAWGRASQEGLEENECNDCMRLAVNILSQFENVYLKLCRILDSKRSKAAVHFVIKVNDGNEKKAIS